MHMSGRKEGQMRSLFERREREREKVAISLKRRLVLQESDTKRPCWLPGDPRTRQSNITSQALGKPRSFTKAGCTSKPCHWSTTTVWKLKSLLRPPNQWMSLFATVNQPINPSVSRSITKITAPLSMLLSNRKCELRERKREREREPKAMTSLSLISYTS